MEFGSRLGVAYLRRALTTFKLQGWGSVEHLTEEETLRSPAAGLNETRRFRS